MTPGEIINALVKAHGKVAVQHTNGNIYYLSGLSKIKFNGVWYEGVSYFSALPVEFYCREIQNFKNFSLVKP